MSEPNPYVGAYPFLASRRGVWREVARYVARDAPGAHRVIELGAGFCDFINAFEAGDKIAFDLNPEMRAHAAPEVQLRVADAVELPDVAANSVDLVFASNFLEHLDTRELARLLGRVREVLRPRGKLVLLQPNFHRCEASYFDDPTHVTIFSERSLAGYLRQYGFEVKKLVPGLLPFSMKSRAPKWPMLVRAYLASPLKPFAAQMYAVAEPAR